MATLLYYTHLALICVSSVIPILHLFHGDLHQPLQFCLAIIQDLEDIVVRHFELLRFGKLHWLQAVGEVLSPPPPITITINYNYYYYY